MRLRSRLRFWRLVSLRSDQASDTQIDATIRDAARLGGTNLWVLMFAIVIASVGLNVNSTAVIIGAMLISPLMGPIIGIGYSAAVFDYSLLRDSLRNLGIFVLISLLASTTYFLLSPLSQAYSELLARTSPTIWDVLIAFFGGAAGMIGLTRKEKTTLIPGVAIATALMPPLCTTGYGIATGQPQFFLGAFYLFLINSVFIALATLVFARILRIRAIAVPDDAARRRGRLIIWIATLVTLIPSIYLALQLTGEQMFTTRAERFIATLQKQDNEVIVITNEINAKERLISLSLMGPGVNQSLQKTWEDQLPAFGLTETTLNIRHPSEAKIDLDSLKSELYSDIMRNVISRTKENTARLSAIEARVEQVRRGPPPELAQVEAEIRAQLPEVQRVVVIRLADQSILVAIESRAKTRIDIDRLKRWLEIRLNQQTITVVSGSFR